MLHYSGHIFCFPTDERRGGPMEVHMAQGSDCTCRRTNWSQDKASNMHFAPDVGGVGRHCRMLDRSGGQHNHSLGQPPLSREYAELARGGGKQRYALPELDGREGRHVHLLHHATAQDRHVVLPEAHWVFQFVGQVDCRTSHLASGFDCADAVPRDFSCRERHCRVLTRRGRMWRPHGPVVAAFSRQQLVDGVDPKLHQLVCVLRYTAVEAGDH
ncbi:hypothetical protein H257_10946 [Aphanomyces astaci]|uniref:Uncharacterized protein n=1 Tax=Aphanomyces astaci TaxID=112090 RepID=W4G5Z2_APHAT|nr:hypothetical protein H257_10946 [Aphanomyces astaci]ETV74353.1 hypothetical protein H257_10946 [Aphanomyces astaci]|eukprot:XP_009836011.1 hypothetical protein H257_10946 [Aphanomyces astaci]